MRVGRYRVLRNKEFLFYSRLPLFKVNNVVVTISIDLELKTSGHHQIQFIFNQSGICKTKDNLMQDKGQLNEED